MYTIQPFVAHTPLPALRAGCTARYASFGQAVAEVPESDANKGVPGPAALSGQDAHMRGIKTMSFRLGLRTQFLSLVARCRPGHLQVTG